jgi:hypothetical protein
VVALIPTKRMITCIALNNFNIQTWP